MEGEKLYTSRTELVKEKLAVGEADPSFLLYSFVVKGGVCRGGEPTDQAGRGSIGCVFRNRLCGRSIVVMSNGLGWY